jgi:hypothetical protein
VRRALLLLLVAAGCGGDSEQPRRARTPVTEVERVAAVIREQSAAIARGDGERACGYFSERVVKEIDGILARRSPELRPVCADALGEVAGRLPRRAVGALRRPVLTEVRVRGDRATVTVEPPPELLALARQVGREDLVGGGTPLRKIGGRWKVDALKL